jgi:hypothetical protein
MNPKQPDVLLADGERLKIAFKTPQYLLSIKVSQDGHPGRKVRKSDPARQATQQSKESVSPISKIQYKSKAVCCAKTLKS